MMQGLLLDVPPVAYDACSVWKSGDLKTSVHFSAATDDWATPHDVFDSLNAEFGFTLDACASDMNAKCARYYTEAEDGLKQPWIGECVYCNPPYGNVIADWLAKGFRAASEGVTSVFLIPSRTDTAWFHRYVCAASEVRFIKGRLKFGGSLNSAPFPSMIVVFRATETDGGR